MLNSIVNPPNAPTPIQYQYASVTNPRDFRTSIPSGSIEFGRTLRIKVHYQLIVQILIHEYRNG